MPPFYRVAPALPEEREAAFGRIFQHCGADERDYRVANVLNLIRQGELDPAGLFAVHGPGGVYGALICQPVPGAGGLVWPPQVAPWCDAREALEDELIRQAGAWLRQRGARLAQALLAPPEAHLAAPLLRNGFVHVTRLLYMRHNLEGSDVPVAAEGLTCVPYAAADPAAFGRTLERTYEGTLDCPEVNGIRTLEETLEGHRAQGVHDPARWWLVRAADEPVAVVLLTAVPEWRAWDLSYLGVVPEARRCGVGRALLRRVLYEARAAGVLQVTLSVDLRNQPALALYQTLGFVAFDGREVYLAIWQRAVA